MLIPHATRRLHQSQPLPRATVIRYARRLQAARRWGRATPPSTVPTIHAPSADSPSLFSGAPPGLSEPATRHLVTLARAFHARGWVSATVLTSFGAGDPAELHRVLLDGYAAHRATLLKPIAALVDGVTPQAFAALSAPSLSELSGDPQWTVEVFHTNSPIVDFPRLPAPDTRALLAAWDAAAKDVPFMVSTEHLLEVLDWTTEQLRDAALDSRWDGEQVVVDPARLETLSEDLGWELDDAHDLLRGFINDERLLDALRDTAIPPDTELTPPVRHVCECLRDLALLAPTLPPFPEIEGGLMCGTSAMLALPNHLHKERIDYGLQSMSEGEDAMQFCGETLDQVLDALDALTLHQAAAHAAFSLVLSLHAD